MRPPAISERSLWRSRAISAAGSFAARTRATIFGRPVERGEALRRYAMRRRARHRRVHNRLGFAAQLAPDVRVTVWVSAGKSRSSQMA
jgi:hypothetical protein